MSKYQFRVTYRRRHAPILRRFSMVVTARSTDEARSFAEMRDPLYDGSIKVQRLAEVIPVAPESADPVTAYKIERERNEIARDDLLEGVAHFDWHGHDIEVEVV